MALNELPDYGPLQSRRGAGMAGKIFVNYRRDDERAFAARVRDRLAQAFGNSNVFMDVDNLMAGQRFDRELEKALTETDVFLAVIGPRWMDLYRQRQVSGDRDYVHEEIAGALKRGITVIPVLIEGAQLPRQDLLPEDIRELVLHHKQDVGHEHFGQNVAALVEAIRFARRSGRQLVAMQKIRAGTLALLLAGSRKWTTDQMPSSVGVFWRYGSSWLVEVCCGHSCFPSNRDRRSPIVPCSAASPRT